MSIFYTLQPLIVNNIGLKSDLNLLLVAMVGSIDSFVISTTDIDNQSCNNVVDKPNPSCLKCS